MMGELIVRNLLHRPLRTLIGVLAVAVEVALVVLIVGLTSGLLTETAKRIEGIGADVMVQPNAASIFIGITGAPMPIKIADKLAELKYVQSVAPALLQFSSTGGVDVVYGIDPESFRAVSGGFVFLQGHDMEGPEDLLVDDLAATAKHIKVGDTYKLLNHDWHVAGIVEHGKGARLFVPLATLQDLVGAPDKASIFWVKCTRPEHTEDVMDETRHLLPGYTVRPVRAMLTLMTSTNIPGLADVYRRHDLLGGRHRPAGDFLDDVYDGDRADARYRCTEIAWRGPGIHRPRAADRVGGALPDGHCGRGWTELRSARRIFRGLPHPVHSHYIAMDSSCRGNRAGGSDARRQLSSVDGQPQRPRRSAFLRLKSRSTPTATESRTNSTVRKEKTPRTHAAARQRWKSQLQYSNLPKG